MEGEIDVSGSSTPEKPPKPAKGEGENTEEIRLAAMAASWSGPLPPPAALEQFERASPGAADRILRMAEREEQHRHRLEQEMQRSDSKIRSRGQIMAFVLALMVIGGGVWLIDRGRNWEGLVAILAPVATLIGLFLYNQERGPGSDDY
jgi:uncharacterized membrane protein